MDLSTTWPVCRPHAREETRDLLYTAQLYNSSPAVQDGTRLDPAIDSIVARLPLAAS
jgi:hypothetical protein